MSKNIIISLIQMHNEENGIVIDILGGEKATRRLEALGIRVGKRITKKSKGFLWGPVTVQVGGTRLGIGYGMASKVMVEVKR